MPKMKNFQGDDRRAGGMPAWKTASFSRMVVTERYIVVYIIGPLKIKNFPQDSDCQKAKGRAKGQTQKQNRIDE